MYMEERDPIVHRMLLLNIYICWNIFQLVSVFDNNPGSFGSKLSGLLLLELAKTLSSLTSGNGCFMVDEVVVILQISEFQSYRLRTRRKK